MNRTIEKFLADKSAVTAVEYGVFVALISCIIIGVAGAVGTGLQKTFSTVASSL